MYSVDYFYSFGVGFLEFRATLKELFSFFETNIAVFAKKLVNIFKEL
jgi:hypothetical protein